MNQSLEGQRVRLKEGDQIIIESPTDRQWLVIFLGLRRKSHGDLTTFLHDSPSGDDKMTLSAHTEREAICEMIGFLRALEFRIEKTGEDRRGTQISLFFTLTSL